MGCGNVFRRIGNVATGGIVGAIQGDSPGKVLVSNLSGNLSSASPDIERIVTPALNALTLGGVSAVDGNPDTLKGNALNFLTSSGYGLVNALNDKKQGLGNIVAATIDPEGTGERGITATGEEVGRWFGQDTREALGNYVIPILMTIAGGPFGWITGSVGTTVGQKFNGNTNNNEILKQAAVSAVSNYMATGAAQALSPYVNSLTTTLTSAGMPKVAAIATAEAAAKTLINTANNAAVQYGTTGDVDLDKLGQVAMTSAGSSALSTLSTPIRTALTPEMGKTAATAVTAAGSNALNQLMTTGNVDPAAVGTSAATALVQPTINALTPEIGKTAATGIVGAGSNALNQFATTGNVDPMAAGMAGTTKMIGTAFGPVAGKIASTGAGWAKSIMNQPPVKQNTPSQPSSPFADIMKGAPLKQTGKITVNPFDDIMKQKPLKV